MLWWLWWKHNIAQEESHDVNRRVVYHSTETGSGYEGFSSFCSIMNIPCLSKCLLQASWDNFGCLRNHNQRRIHHCRPEVSKAYHGGEWRVWYWKCCRCCCQFWWHLGEKRLYIIHWCGFCGLSGHRWGTRLPCFVKSVHWKKASVKVMMNNLLSGGENIWQLENVI